VIEPADEIFATAAIISYIIYRKDSKGSYQTLAKMAEKLPIFQDIQNERFMPYMEKLCEFLSQVMAHEEGGIFWPQNVEYTRTSEMVNPHKVSISKA